MNLIFIFLASILAIDALLSIRPLAFIQRCLSGVGFPKEWWWVLIVIKILASAGLFIGVWNLHIGIASTIGVIAYFFCAAVAHIRRRFFGLTFWINCCGMLLLALGTFIFAVLH